MKSLVAKTFAVLVLGSVAAVASCVLWVEFDAVTPFFGGKAPVLVDVPPGTRSITIARLLEDSGVIRNHYTFLFLHYINRKRTLKAGTYSFERPLTPKEIMRELISGEVAKQEITIPEGYNRFDIAALIEGAGFATRKDFLKATEETGMIADIDPAAPNLEGYLFPDTYQFPRHGGATPVVREMVSRFRKVYKMLLPRDQKVSAHDAVTIASMIEGETGNAEERPVVASVFYNRLRRGLPMQCDPTVIYAAILENSYGGVIRQADLNSNSPYNTYIHTGLPPGPISNPGKAALIAALHPATTKYIYFVANNTGRHTFSKTLTEHNLAVSLYRRGLAEKADASPIDK
jgi:peptidoglycan lytic transglycosylase G